LNKKGLCDHLGRLPVRTRGAKMTDSVRAVALVSAAAAAGVLWRCRRAAAPSCPPLIGIMAGMGPKAGAEFFASLVDGRVALFRAMAAAATGDAGGMLAAVAAMSDAPWTAAEVAAVWRRTEKRGALDDADHVPALVYSNAQIPNRPRFLDGTRADDPLPELLRTARVLFRGGATVLCIVCNTAHAWLAPIQAALDADAEAAGAGEAGPRLLSKPRQALLAVRRRCGRGGGELGQSDRQTKDRRLRVGLLATSGTLSSGVYASAAADVAVDAEILAPTEDGQRAVEEVIFGLRGIKVSATVHAVAPAVVHAAYHAYSYQSRRAATTWRARPRAATTLTRCWYRCRRWRTRAPTL